MISILTAIVLMVVIGTMIQRADGFSFISGSETPRALVGDQATVRANSLHRIDVLANDTGLESGDARRLVVKAAPACGRVFVQDGAFQYLAEDACVGRQRIVYGIGDESLEGVVEIAVLGADGTPAVRRVPVTNPGSGAPAPAGEDVVATAPAPEAAAPSDAGAGEAEQLAALAEPRPSRTGPEAIAAAGVALDEAAVTPGDDRPDPVRLAGVRNLAIPLSTPGRALSRTPRLADRDPLAGIADTPPDVSGRPTEMAAVAAAQFDRLDGEPQTGSLGIVEGWRSFLPSLAPRALDFSKVLIERPEPTAVPPAAPVAGLLRLEPGFGVPPSLLPDVDIREDVRIAVAVPDELAMPGTIRDLPLDPLPVDPEELPLPRERLSPTAAPAAAGTPEPTPDRPAEADDGTGPLAALPPAAARCAAPPSMTLDIRRAAVTGIILSAPCHAGTIATLSYAGMEFAISLDGRGEGRILTLGFADSTPALITFDDGEKLDFDLPFRGIDRVTRVAMVWEAPVALGLNALEFGAAPGSAGHVHAGNPRDFAQARRSHGGFLTRFHPVAGIGQNVQIYTFWHQRGSGPGVVKLLIDYAQQPEDVVSAACNGADIQPEVTILRSETGAALRPVLRKLPSLECSYLTRENGDNRLIFDAVDDVVVLQR